MKTHRFKKIILASTITLSIFASTAAYAQSDVSAQEPRRYPPEIMLAGDSWGSFLCSANGYPKTFKKLRVRNLAQSEDCDHTTDSGIEAREWLDSYSHDQVIRRIRDKHSPVKYIHLSLGGNDLIADWTKNLSTEQEQAIFERNFQLLQQIVQIYLNTNKNVRVIVSGYDFPRFTPDHKISKYRKILAKMGSPTPAELNAGLVRYHKYIENRFQTHADYKTRVFVIHHLGLGHFYLGIPDGGIGAGQTLHPDLISSLTSPEAFGGDLNFMSPKKWMTQWIGNIYDAFHLSDEGYQLLAEHVYKNIIKQLP